MNKLDFAKGYKTITGIILLLAPYLKAELGIEITSEDMDLLFNNLMNITGGVFFVYGLVMKIRRKWLEQKQKSQ